MKSRSLMNAFIDEVFIECIYNKSNHIFEYNIERYNKTRLNEIRLSGGKLITDYQRVLILTKSNIIRLYLSNPFIDEACRDYSFLIKRVITSKNRISCFFDEFDYGYHFHSNLFNVIETIGVELTEIIERIFGTIVLITISDVHGDLSLLLLPLFIGKRCSRIEFDEELNVISFDENSSSNSVVVINGDLFPKNDYRSDFYKFNIKPIFDRLLIPFISNITLVLIRLLDIRFVIGNHDGPLFNKPIRFETSFDSVEYTFDNSDLLKYTFVRVFFGDKLGDNTRVISFMHGIYESHEGQLSKRKFTKSFRDPTFESIENGVRIKEFNFDNKLYHDWYSRRNDFNIDSYRELEEITIRKILNDNSTSIDQSKSILYLSVLGHSADCDLIYRNVNSSNELDKFDKLELIESRFDSNLRGVILENVICIDSESNSIVNIDTKNIIEFIENRIDLLPSRILELRFPFVEEGIQIK